MLHRTTMLLALLFLALPMSRAAGQDPAADAGAHWGANYFPNARLVTQDGRAVRFFDDLLAGKVVLINFIYTTCPDSCPLESAKLAEVQELLGERLGRDIFFYSISIDPEHDTPAVLKEYAERFGARAGWQFLTGAAQDVLLLRRKLGLYVPGDEQGNKDHNLSFVIGNQKTGQWLRRSPFESPQVLAEDLGGRLSDWRERSGQVNDYADAPELRSLSQGESLFRTRCTVCHAIGTGDGLPRVGPNLFGVIENRERAWLERWLREPDAMLAEGDPIASALFEAYNRVPMPNLRLGAADVEALLAFVQGESQRVARLETTVAAVKEKSGEAPPACCQKKAQGTLGASPAQASFPPTAVVALDPGVFAGPRLSAVARLSIGMGLALGLATLVLRAQRCARAAPD